MHAKPSSLLTAPLQLWGGLECTVNRIKGNYFIQIDRNGHSHRFCDIERFSSLGIQAIRYPVLWGAHRARRAGHC